MDERIKLKEQELKEIISDKIDEMYVEAHQLIETTGGDITPCQVFELGKIKDKLFEQIAEQVQQNLPENASPTDDDDYWANRKAVKDQLAMDNKPYDDEHGSY